MADRASVALFRVILPVTSIADAVSFYSAITGTSGVTVSPGRHYFDCGGVVLACYDRAADGDGEPFDRKRPPEQYFYFAVDDLEAMLATVASEGGTVQEPGIIEAPWGERLFWAHDPFGNQVSFVDRTTMFTGDLVDRS